jgi:hypothetical protein
VRDYPTVVVDADLGRAVRFGKVLPVAAFAVGDPAPPAWAVLDERGDLLAVYEPHRGDTAKPSVVIAPAS